MSGNKFSLVSICSKFIGLVYDHCAGKAEYKHKDIVSMANTCSSMGVLNILSANA